MPAPQSKGQGGGKKNKKIKNQNNNLNATQDKTNDDERIEQEEELGGALDNLNSTSVWNSQKKIETDISGKQGNVVEPVEGKSEASFPKEQSEAAEVVQQDDELFRDQQEAEQPEGLSAGTQRSEVTEADHQGDELPYGQTEGLSTETQPSEPVQAEQEDLEPAVDPLGERDSVKPQREELKEKESVDDQGDLGEDSQRPSNQTQDEKEEEGALTVDDAISSKPTEATESSDKPPGPTERSKNTSLYFICDNCDDPITDEHFHCHVCDGGNYDLSLACADSGIQCPGSARHSHSMVRRFVSHMPLRGILKHTSRDARRMLSGSREPRPYGYSQLDLSKSTPPQQTPITARTPADPVIKMIVNGNMYDLVVSRKLLLSRNTSYFAMNTREDTHSTAGRKFGLYVNFKGKQFSIDVIKQYSQWLQDDLLHMMQELGPITFANAAPTLIFLVRAHTFGEKINDKRWLNDVMDAFVKVHSEARLTAALPELVHHVYEYSHEKPDPEAAC